MAYWQLNWRLNQCFLYCFVVKFVLFQNAILIVKTFLWYINIKMLWNLVNPLLVRRYFCVLSWTISRIKHSKNWNFLEIGWKTTTFGYWIGFCSNSDLLRMDMVHGHFYSISARDLYLSKSRHNRIYLHHINYSNWAFSRYLPFLLRS